jgi:hypothetical protein
MTSPYEQPEPADDLGRRVLEAQERFQLVLLDGTRWSCSLVAWGRYDLLVRTESGRYLVPQHAIAYVALDEEAPALLREAAAVAVASEAELAADDTVAGVLPGPGPEALPEPPVP